MDRNLLCGLGLLLGIKMLDGYGPDLTKQTSEQLVQVLSAGTLPQQRLARDLLVDRHGAQAVPFLRAGLSSPSGQLRRNSLRLLSQLGELQSADLVQLLGDSDETVRVHVFRKIGRAHV